MLNDGPFGDRIVKAQSLDTISNIIGLFYRVDRAIADGIDRQISDIYLVADSRNKGLTS